MRRVRWFEYVVIGARLHYRFETLVAVNNIDLLVLLILLVSILFRSKCRSLIFSVHWPIPLELRVLESFGSVLA